LRFFFTSPTRSSVTADFACPSFFLHPEHFLFLGFSSWLALNWCLDSGPHCFPRQSRRDSGQLPVPADVVTVYAARSVLPLVSSPQVRLMIHSLLGQILSSPGLLNAHYRGRSRFPLVVAANTFARASSSYPGGSSAAPAGLLSFSIPDRGIIPLLYPPVSGGRLVLLFFLSGDRFPCSSPCS